jgi:hypothetical protein
MAESPNLASQNERVTRLAERYGMTRADIELLLTATHAEYSKDTPPTPALLPEPPIARPRSNPKPLSGGFLAVVFAVLLIGLGIAASLKQGCFPQRSDRRMAAENRAHQKSVDTLKKTQNPAASQADSSSEQPSAPIPPTNVPPGQLPPESLSGIPKSIAHHATPAAARPLLQTTSNFEAEERLADLRADGNTKARIKSVRKRGAISYQIFSK